MAVSKWTYPHTLTEEQKEAKKNPAPKDPYPSGYNEVLATDFWDKLIAGREKYVDTEKDYRRCCVFATCPFWMQQRLCPFFTSIDFINVFSSTSAYYFPA